MGGESIDADGVRGMGTPSSTSSRGGRGATRDGVQSQSGMGARGHEKPFRRSSR